MRGHGYEHPSRVSTPGAARAELRRLRKGLAGAKQAGDVKAQQYLYRRLSRLREFLGGLEAVPASLESDDWY